MGVVYPVADDVTALLAPYVAAGGGPDVDTVYAHYLEVSLGRITPQQAFWEAVGLGSAYPVVEQDCLATCWAVG